MNKLDIIVLGATGFTGKYVVDVLVKTTKDEKYFDVTFGIAGRSKEKLQNLVQKLTKTGVDISKIPVFEADINNEESLKKLATQTKILMNCTGPYTVLSDPVVKACLQSGTHYLDISAELHHMLNIYTLYNKTAEDENVLIIPSCGFASIPLTSGLTLLQRNFQGVLHMVECYTELDIPKRTYYPGPNKCLVHYGTWASLVYELQNRKKYLEQKKETFPDTLFGPEYDELQRSFFHRNDGQCWYPYPGPEKDVVEMGERYLKEKKGKRPVYCKVYTTMPHPVHFAIVPAFLFYYYASYWKFFRNLLWKHPKVFTLGYMSHKGPSEEMMKQTKYSFNLVGRGWDTKPNGNVKECPPNKVMKVKVSGCDPGYETTAVAFVISALTVLKESHKMPKGGVLSTEAAFYETDIIENLNKYGIKFELCDT